MSDFKAEEAHSISMSHKHWIMFPSYEDICRRAWGCVPKDIKWAKSSPLFEEARKTLIKERKNGH